MALRLPAASAVRFAPVRLPIAAACAGVAKLADAPGLGPGPFGGGGSSPLARTRLGGGLIRELAAQIYEIRRSMPPVRLICPPASAPWWPIRSARTAG